MAEGLAGIVGGVTTLPRARLTAWIEEARAVARAHAVFHWELAFPEVFFDADGRPRPLGGFDAVIGNPPWDVLRADTGSARRAAVGSIAHAARLRFFRSSGTYGCQGGGHANRYQLFLERAWQLARPGGRWGLILPSGIATDHGSSLLRRRLFDRCRVDTWLGFDNRHAIFPIHRSVRFVLMSATNGGSTERLDFHCGLQKADVLDQLPSRRAKRAQHARLSVSRSRLESWDPEHLTVPEIAQSAGAGHLHPCRRLASAPVIAARMGRAVRPRAERHRRSAALRRAKRHRDSLPIVEGKHLEPFQVMLEHAAARIPRAIAATLIDPHTSFDRVRLAYRDVASATNRVTLIAALLPRGHALDAHGVLPEDAARHRANGACSRCSTAFRELPGPAQRHDPRDDGADGAPAGAAPVATVGGVPRARRARPHAGGEHGIDAAPDAYARINAIAANLYGLTSEQYEHVVAQFPSAASGAP